MSASSDTCAQRTGRSSRSAPATTSGRPRRTASSARTAASVGDGVTPTVCHREAVWSDELPGVRAGTGALRSAPVGTDDDGSEGRRSPRGIDFVVRNGIRRRNP